MGTVGSTTLSNALRFGSQRKTDRCQNGVQWTAWLPNSGATSAFYLSYSTDNGVTWTGQSFGPNKPSGSTSASYVDLDMYIDVDDYMHVAFRDGADGRMYYVRGTPNVTRTGYTWSTAQAVSSGGIYAEQPSIVAHRQGSGWRMHLVYCIFQGATQNDVVYAAADIAAGGAITMIGATTLYARTGVSVRYYPSIEFRHTGDAKTVAGATPDLCVAWSAGAVGSTYGIRARIAPYSGGTWTWNAAREIDTSRYVSSEATSLAVLCDGFRWVIAGMVDGQVTESFAIWERDFADTTTTARYTTISSTDRLYYGSWTYAGNGDVYFFGHTTASSTPPGGYRKWNRATGVLDASVVVDSATSSTAYFSARRGTSGGSLDYVYIDGTSPLSILSGRLVLNAAPTAATSTAPANGANVDRTQPIVAQWAFNDPDAGDSQSRADLRYRVVATPVAAWTTVTNAATTATNYTWAPNTFAAGQQVEWQVLTRDSQGVVAGGVGAEAWSASSFFTVINPPSVAITDPSIDGSSVATQGYTVRWSASAQDAYQVMRAADSGGVVQPLVYSDTGVVEDSTSRARTLNFDTNNRTEHVLVRVRYQGIWSAWADRRVVVSYTAPPTPVAVLTPDDNAVAMAIAITNPAPSGSQPTVTGNQVWVDNGDGLGSILLVEAQAPNSTYVYRLARPFYDYAENKVRVVALGANGTNAEAFAT